MAKRDKAAVIGTCIYCGEVRPITRDHVPPKNLYSKPYPANMRTVPACQQCNGGFSKDDEYFRVALTITEDAKVHPEREAVLPTVLRGLNKPEAKRFRGNIEANTSLVHRFTASGLYLGIRRAVTFEGARLDVVAARIVKGLFFLEKKHRLPDTCSVSVLALYRAHELMDIHPEVDLAFRQFIGLVREQRLERVGKPFAFRWAQSPNGPNNTMWLLYFYGKEWFFCHTFERTGDQSRTLEEEIERVRQAEKDILSSGPLDTPQE